MNVTVKYRTQLDRTKSSDLKKSKSITHSIWLCRSKIWWWKNRVNWNYFLKQNTKSNPC